MASGRPKTRRAYVSPAEHDPYLSICAKLGLRLGRLEGWGLTGRDRNDDAFRFAVRSINACDAFGLSLLAGRLRLSAEARESIAELLRQVDEYLALDRDSLPEECPYAQHARELFLELRVELEIQYGDECVRAFYLGFDLYPMQSCFRIWRDGSRPTGESLREVLYEEELHDWVSEGLGWIADYLESQDEPPAVAAELRRYADGFRDRALSATRIARLRSRILGPWIDEIEAYFSPVHGSDLSELEPGLSAAGLAAACFRIGELYGLFEMWIVWTADDYPRARDNLKRLRLLLARAGLPLDTRLVADRLDVPELGGSKPELPPGVTRRAEYGYVVTAPLFEAAGCLHGRVIETVVRLGHGVGALAEAVSSEADCGAEDAGDLFLDPAYRKLITQFLDQIVDALDLRWVDTALADRVRHAIEAWRQPYAPPGQTLALRDFFTEEFRDAVLRQAGTALALGPAAVRTGRLGFDPLIDVPPPRGNGGAH
jgi:hypothetical protein